MLLRKLCPNCRESYVPNPEMLAKANLSGQRIERFYRPPTKPLTDEKGNPIGCVACQGTGYLGRTAVFELLEVTDEVRQLIVTGATLAQIKATCRKNRMLYLQEQALQRVIDGVTSVQELIRVSQADKKS
jgi:type II secretory ATPase GspE/PulE/Tfp pilus assembly ATPase PilB-like protein